MVKRSFKLSQKCKKLRESWKSKWGIHELAYLSCLAIKFIYALWSKWRSFYYGF
jgi:hypothetical protein